MRGRKTHTDKLVERLEKTLHRDLGGGPFSNFPLVKKYRDYYRAVSITYSDREIIVTLQSESDLRERYYVEGHHD